MSTKDYDAGWLVGYLTAVLICEWDDIVEWGSGKVGKMYRHFLDDIAQAVKAAE